MSSTYVLGLVGLLDCWINEDSPAQRILGEAVADRVTEAVKDWLVRVEKNSFLVFPIGMIQGAGFARLWRVAFQGRQQPIKPPRLERTEGKDTLDIAFDPDIDQWRGIFQEATNIARQQTAIGLLLHRHPETRETALDR